MSNGCILFTLLQVVVVCCDSYTFEFYAKRKKIKSLRLVALAYRDEKMDID